MTALSGRSLHDVGTSTDFFAITGSDTTTLAVATRWVSIAVAGALAVVKEDGTSVTLTLPAGIFPLRVVQVKATGTTATGIVGYV